MSQQICQFWTSFATNIRYPKYHNLVEVQTKKFVRSIVFHSQNGGEARDCKGYLSIRWPVTITPPLKFWPPPIDGSLATCLWQPKSLWIDSILLADVHVISQKLCSVMESKLRTIRTVTSVEIIQNRNSSRKNYLLYNKTIVNFRGASPMTPWPGLLLDPTGAPPHQTLVIGISLPRSSCL